MQLKNAITHVPECNVKHTVRAKYYRTAEGVTKLAKVQQLSFPAFRISGFEDSEGKSEVDVQLDKLFAEAEASVPEDQTYDQDAEEKNRARVLRRAKNTAFDKILCNPDLDIFVTLTIDPEVVFERDSYDEIYNLIKHWLKNRVQRRDLKYVMPPEHHKNGAIHFHAIMNSSALDLVPAINYHTKNPLYHNGQPLYNVSDWKFGFSSAEMIKGADLDREKVAKYIFKYMGKQGIEGKIGGRYVLSGGKFEKPIYVYGDSALDFILDVEGAYFRMVEHDGGIYKEWSFI